MGRGWGIRDRRLVGMVVNVIRRGCYDSGGIGLESVGKGKGWHWKGARGSGGERCGVRVGSGMGSAAHMRWME